MSGTCAVVDMAASVQYQGYRTDTWQYRFIQRLMLWCDSRSLSCPFESYLLIFRFQAASLCLQSRFYNVIYYIIYIHIHIMIYLTLNMYIWIWFRAPAMPRNKLRKDFGVGVGDAKIRQTSKTMLVGRVMFIIEVHVFAAPRTPQHFEVLRIVWVAEPMPS